MSKKPDNAIKNEFNLRMLSKTQVLIRKREESNMSQSDISKALGVSLKTIQRFEHYKTMSGYLIFGYKKLLSIE